MMIRHTTSVQLFQAFWILTLFFSSHKIQGFFAYDRAVHAAHQGNWPYANSLLNQLVVDDPKNPSKLYDAGVTAYKLKDFKQAESYFTTATQMVGHDKQLQEKTFFNLGNAQAQQKKLKEAIGSYEAALVIRPDDAHAQHNLELIKKMLEQEQKQQENKQQQDQKDKKQQNQNKQQEQQNKEDGAQSEQQQSSDKEQQKQDQDKKEKDTNKNSPQDEADQKKQNQDQGDKEESEKNEREKEQKEQQQSQQSGNDEKQNSNQSQGEAEEKRSNEDIAKKIDAHLAQVLDQREQRDGELNKQFIKAQVGKQLTGHHGQNCW